MPSTLHAVKPLLDRGASIASHVPGPAGGIAERFTGGGSARQPEPDGTDQALGTAVRTVGAVTGYESRLQVPNAPTRKGRKPAPAGSKDAS